MPRKKRTTIDEILPDDTPNANGDPDISDIVVVLTKVYKLNGPTRSYCFQSVEPVDELVIQSQYANGGKFEVLELNNVGETVNKTIIDIEPKPILASPLGNGQGPGQSDFQVRMLLDELQFSRQMILTMLQNKGNGHEATPVAELISGMQGLHALSSQKDPVELLVKGMELANKVNGGTPDWKSQLLETVKEVAGPALTAFSSMRASTANLGQPPMVANGPAQLPPADVIKSGLQWLKSKILKGLDPGLAVDMLLMNADDEKYQPILTTAIRGSIDDFIAIDPELGNEPFRAWFTNAIQLLKDWYAEQNNDGADLERGNGNSPDTSNDAENRTRKPKIAKVV